MSAENNYPSSNGTGPFYIFISDETRVRYVWIDDYDDVEFDPDKYAGISASPGKHIVFLSAVPKMEWRLTKDKSKTYVVSGEFETDGVMTVTADNTPGQFVTAMPFSKDVFKVLFSEKADSMYLLLKNRSLDYQQALNNKSNSFTVSQPSTQTAITDRARWEQRRKYVVKTKHMFAVSSGNFAGVKEDGTVCYVGNSEFGQSQCSNWSGMIAIYGGRTSYDVLVGIHYDGTLKATRYTGDRFWSGPVNVNGLSGVEDLVVSNGCFLTLSNGRVNAKARIPRFGQEKPDELSLSNANKYGQANCWNWANIVEVDGAFFHNVGLKEDHTVISTEVIRDKPEYEAEFPSYFGQDKVSGWRDIIEISASSYHTLGLRADGTVVSTKITLDKYYNKYDNKDEIINYGQDRVEGWSDIVSIAASNKLSLGLKSDGTCVAVGYLTDKDVSQWKDIVGIYTESGVAYGIKSDGTIVSTNAENNEKLRYFKLFDSIETLKSRAERIALLAQQPKKTPPVTTPIPPSPTPTPPVYNPPKRKKHGVLLAFGLIFLLLPICFVALYLLKLYSLNNPDFLTAFPEFIQKILNTDIANRIDGTGWAEDLSIITGVLMIPSVICFIVRGVKRRRRR